MLASPLMWMSPWKQRRAVQMSVCRGLDQAAMSPASSAVTWLPRPQQLGGALLSQQGRSGQVQLWRPLKMTVPLLWALFSWEGDLPVPRQSV